MSATSRQRADKTSDPDMLYRVAQVQVHNIMHCNKSASKYMVRTHTHYHH